MKHREGKYFMAFFLIFVLSLWIQYLVASFEIYNFGSDYGLGNRPLATDAIRIGLFEKAVLFHFLENFVEKYSLIGSLASDFESRERITS